MKTITIRDLRQRWPEAEAALQIEGEIIITRDAKPVAKLVRLGTQAPKRAPWNLAEHRKWIEKVYGRKVITDAQERLAAARADRNFE